MTRPPLVIQEPLAGFAVLIIDPIMKGQRPRVSREPFEAPHWPAVALAAIASKICAVR